MTVSDAVGADTSCVNCGLPATEANVLLGSEGTEKIIGTDTVGKTTCRTECYVMMEHRSKMGGQL